MNSSSTIYNLMVNSYVCRKRCVDGSIGQGPKNTLSLRRDSFVCADEFCDPIETLSCKVLRTLVRLRVVTVSLSPSCVKRKETSRKKWPCQMLAVRSQDFARQFLPHGMT